MRAHRRSRTALVLAVFALALVPSAAAKVPAAAARLADDAPDRPLATHPGGAAALRKSAPFGFRYQYLAGGVNTGKGWSTWNPDGTFATLYVQDSWAHRVDPCAHLLHAAPVEARRAATRRRRISRTSATPTTDEGVLGRRAPAVPAASKAESRSSSTSSPTSGAISSRQTTTALARAFAQQWVQLRNELAPNVLLAYHMSGWGTKHDIVYEDPPDATVRAYAAQSAEFYRSLQAKFDVSFEDFSDRDAGFYEKVQGNPEHVVQAGGLPPPPPLRRHLRQAHRHPHGGVADPARQHDLLNDTPGHYRDNRVQWLLGAGGRAHLRAYANAGYVGFLFGGGADGTTSADTDGGYFRAHVRAYYRQGALRLP